MSGSGSRGAAIRIQSRSPSCRERVGYLQRRGVWPYAQAVPPAQPGPAAAGMTNAPVAGKAALEALGVKALKGLARDAGVDVSRALEKAEIVDALVAANVAAPAPAAAAAPPPLAKGESLFFSSQQKEKALKQEQRTAAKPTAAKREGAAAGKKPPKKKAKKATHATDAEGKIVWSAPLEGKVGGWRVMPPSLIFKDYGAAPSAKIAAFDLDGTLVTTKSGDSFARHAGDFKLFNDDVFRKLQGLADAGFKIVVLSNQGGVKSKLDGKAAEKQMERFDNFVRRATDPRAERSKQVGKDPYTFKPQVFYATLHDEFRKPGAAMWDYMAKECNGGVAIDLAQSFYCGDAAGRAADCDGTGRPADHGDSDKGLAAAVGVKFFTPEEQFGVRKGKWDLVKRDRDADGNKVQGVVASDLPCANPANAKLCEVLTELSDIMFKKDKEGESIAGFKARAFKKAVAALKDHSEAITSGKQAQKLPGIGKGTGEKIDEILRTGGLAVIEELKDAEGVHAAAAASAAKEKEKHEAFAYL